jgi:hypothetical protein
MNHQAHGSFLGDDLARADVQAALDALGGVAKGWDRVVAHHAAPRLVKWATNQYGEVKRASWWGWLLRKPVKYWALTGLPGDDHVEYREREGKRARISQPYQLDWDNLRALVHHCEATGLKVSIHGMSWWFPGWTIAVVVEKDELSPRH